MTPNVVSTDVGNGHQHDQGAAPRVQEQQQDQAGQQHRLDQRALNGVE